MAGLLFIRVAKHFWWKAIHLSVHVHVSNASHNAHFFFRITRCILACIFSCAYVPPPLSCPC